MGSWSANGSPNGPSQVTSPPTTPFAPKDDTWDLIYAAAGQVARLKMTSQSLHLHQQHQQHSLPKLTQIHAQGRGLLGPPQVYKQTKINKQKQKKITKKQKKIS